MRRFAIVIILVSLGKLCSIPPNAIPINQYHQLASTSELAEVSLNEEWRSLAPGIVEQGGSGVLFYVGQLRAVMLQDRPSVSIPRVRYNVDLFNTDHLLLRTAAYLVIANNLKREEIKKRPEELVMAHMRSVTQDLEAILQSETQWPMDLIQRVKKLSDHPLTMIEPPNYRAKAIFLLLVSDLTTLGGRTLVLKEELRFVATYLANSIENDPEVAEIVLILLEGYLRNYIFSDSRQLPTFEEAETYTDMILAGVRIHGIDNLDQLYRLAPPLRSNPLPPLPFPKPNLELMAGHPPHIREALLAREQGLIRAFMEWQNFEQQEALRRLPDPREAFIDGIARVVDQFSLEARARIEELPSFSEVSKRIRERNLRGISSSAKAKRAAEKANQWIEAILIADLDEETEIYQKLTDEMKELLERETDFLKTVIQLFFEGVLGQTEYDLGWELKKLSMEERDRIVIRFFEEIVAYLPEPFVTIFDDLGDRYTDIVGRYHQLLIREDALREL